MICPVYNGESYLPRLIDSIKKQKEPIELIFVLDPSTDNSKSIIEQSGFKAIYNQDRLRLMPSRLEGLKLATGDYIGFVDSDDMLEPDFSKRMMEAADEVNADIIDCNYYWITDKGKKKNSLSRPKQKIYSNREGMKFLLGDIKMRGYVWNKIFKASLFQGIYATTPEFEDMPFVFSLLLKAESIYFLNEPLYDYVKTSSGSFTNTPHKNRAREHLESFLSVRYLCEVAKDKEAIEMVRKSYKRAYWSIWLDIYISKKGGLTRKEAKQIKKALKGLKAKGLLPMSGAFYEEVVKASIKEFPKKADIIKGK